MVWVYFHYHYTKVINFRSGINPEHILFICVALQRWLKPNFSRRKDYWVWRRRSTWLKKTTFKKALTISSEDSTILHLIDSGVDCRSSSRDLPAIHKSIRQFINRYPSNRVLTPVEIWRNLPTKHFPEFSTITSTRNYRFVSSPIFSKMIEIIICSTRQYNLVRLISKRISLRTANRYTQLRCFFFFGFLSYFFYGRRGDSSKTSDNIFKDVTGYRCKFICNDVIGTLASDLATVTEGKTSYCTFTNMHNTSVNVSSWAAVCRTKVS